VAACPNHYSISSISAEVTTTNLYVSWYAIKVAWIWRVLRIRYSPALD